MKDKYVYRLILFFALSSLLFFNISNKLYEANIEKFFNSMEREVVENVKSKAVIVDLKEVQKPYMFNQDSNNNIGYEVIYKIESLDTPLRESISKSKIEDLKVGMEIEVSKNLYKYSYDMSLFNKLLSRNFLEDKSNLYRFVDLNNVNDINSDYENNKIYYTSNTYDYKIDF